VGECLTPHSDTRCSWSRSPSRTSSTRCGDNGRHSRQPRPEINPTINDRISFAGWKSRTRRLSVRSGECPDWVKVDGLAEANCSSRYFAVAGSSVNTRPKMVAGHVPHTLAGNPAIGVRSPAVPCVVSKRRDAPYHSGECRDCVRSRRWCGARPIRSDGDCLREEAQVPNEDTCPWQFLA
jgi:hypothetical protein